MADNFVQIAPDSSGKSIDAQSMLNGAALTVYRQTVTVGDPTSIGAVQSVRVGGSAPAVSDGAAVVVTRPGSGGTTGLDFSANPYPWPNVGTPFSGSGGTPYDGWFLLATLPANPARLKVIIDNMSNRQVLCLRDDGTAVSGATPSNATAFVLNPKVSVGPEGGNYTSQTFLGRIQVYGASTSLFVSVSTD